jgi:tryptophanyl-tRNA synthetase
MEAETLGARFVALGLSFEWTEIFIQSHDRDEAEVVLALS